MPLSNAKPPSPREAPHEPFKRAVAGCLRAMARAPILRSYSRLKRRSPPGRRTADPSGLSEPPPPDGARRRHSPRPGGRPGAAIRLPRGETRSTVVRRQTKSGGPSSTPMEQARVEDWRLRRMVGVAQNLSAPLEQRYERGSYAEIRQRSDAPIEELRWRPRPEKLTGATPPRSAAPLVQLWRETLESRAGSDLSRLIATIDRPKSLRKLSRKISGGPRSGRPGRI